MTAKYPGPGGADVDGRLDMIELFDGYDLASEQPRIDRPPDDDHGEECVAQPWPKGGGDPHGQQDRRERQCDIDKSHQYRVDPLPHEASDRTDERSNDARRHVSHRRYLRLMTQDRFGREMAHELIDVDRYPIDHPGTQRYDQLVQACRHDMATIGCAVMPGFIPAEIAGGMANQLGAIETFNRCQVLSAWGDPPAADLPADHIHRRRFPEDTHVLAGDQLVGTGLRMFYETDVLNIFLADALDVPELHRFGDQFQDLNVVQIKDGGLHAWHYDLSDFVITLLLQKPEVGGQFEFAPFIRGEVIPGVVGGRDGRVWDERYDDVEQLFAGSWPDTHRLDLEPGDLVMFNGLRSMHRVRAVHGSTNRMIAVMSYDTKPGFSSTDAINAHLYGPRCQELLNTHL